MFGAVTKRLEHTWFLLPLIIAAFSIQSFGQTIVENGFEKGTEKWEARGERVSITSSKDQAASGTKSLKISGRSANWQGGQLNLTKAIVGKKTYKFSVAVKLAKGESPDDVKMTMQRGDTVFDFVGGASVNADSWTTITGIYRYPGGDSYALIYIESIRPNTSYFIDDFKIEDAGDGTPKQEGVILQNDFEDMTAQSWIEHGDNVSMFSSNAAGSQSLKVTGRTQTWHGLALDVSPLMYKGRTYEISVSARLLKGQPADSLKITIEQTPPKGDKTWVHVNEPTKVTDAAWVTLSGKYTPTTTDNNLLLFIETNLPATSFYIDNFVVKVAEGSK